VLAGGRSARFGRDKLAEPYRGAPILERAVERVAAVCSDVVVVMAHDAPHAAGGTGVRVVRDDEPAGGPLVGLSAGLRAVDRDVALVVGGDMPDLQVPVLAEMLRAAAGTLAVALRDGRRVRPLPCVVRVAVASALAEALLRSGRRRLRDLLDEMAVTPVEEPAWTALDPLRRTLFDVDVPADLAT
jgi:molybdopterin-guanine dinucleotide biosynthesis protein A